MRLIPTKIHGLLDYLVGVLLVLSPSLMGYGTGGAETWIPVVIGSGALVYNLFTDYELGIMRKLSLRTHRVLDLLLGILLAASPWIFGFTGEVFVPHLLFGVFLMAASLLSQRQPPRHIIPVTGWQHETC